MEERDAIFRQRLVAVMAALNKDEFRDPAVRRVVGGVAYKLIKDAGVKSWAELKARIDAPSYDSLLKLLQDQGAAFDKAGDSKSLRGVEALALSLVAKTQRQNDLLPGVGFLDRFIESCASLAKPTAKVMASTPAPRGKR